MRIALVVAATAIFVTACASAPPPQPAAKEVPTLSTARQAVANLASASGSLVSGKVTLAPMSKGGVHLTGVVGGLPPNSQHGFHVHEKGDCSSVDAASAGAHFNPFNASHGKAASGERHAGDMDNILADGEGVVRLDAHLGDVTLGGGAVNDIAGRALIVHAVADDYRSQPAGNAGARVACGVIRVTQ